MREEKPALNRFEIIKREERYKHRTFVSAKVSIRPYTLSFMLSAMSIADGYPSSNKLEERREST